MRADKGFINGSNLQFKDISSESFREYSFPNGKTLYIANPLYLHVSESGGHRLYDAQGVSWYVQPKEGWHIKWESKEDSPSFVK